MKKIIFSSSQTEEIKRLYIKEQMSLKSIGEQFGVSRSVISRVLEEEKIEKRKTTHLYKANYRAFQTIDTPEKAYWLGFLAADGCVYVRPENAAVKVQLSVKDINHLKKFKQFMDSNVNIKTIVQNNGFSNNTEVAVITFNSMDMATDLIDKGVVPKKSLILQPPKIDPEFYLPFIKGYFDGDGSLFQTQQGEWGISFLGTKEMLLWIKSILGWANNLEQKKDCTSNCYYIRCGGLQKPYSIISQFYETTEVSLDRKQEKYKELQTVVLSRNAK